MREIVDKHFPEIEDELISKALQLFYHFRNLGLERSPSTRELLNWLKYLNTFEINLAIQKIENREGLGVLVKTKEDLQKIKLNGRY
jgi:hypothetical protein